MKFANIEYIEWSHWGELNSRPSHYQWDAIPLSHSGAVSSKAIYNLITTDIDIFNTTNSKLMVDWIESPAEIA